MPHYRSPYPFTPFQTLERIILPLYFLPMDTFVIRLTIVSTEIIRYYITKHLYSAFNDF